MQSPGLVHIPGVKGVDQRGNLLRHDVGGYRDDAHASTGHQGKGDEIVARQDVYPVSAEGQYLRCLLEGAGCFLDAHDVGYIGQPGNRFREHIHGGATRYVVKDLGERNRLRYRLVVAVQSFLGRLVVVRGHEERAIRPHPLCMLGDLDSLRGGVGSGAGDDRYPFFRLLHHDFDDPVVLFVVEGGCLAGSPARNDAVRAVLNLELDQFSQVFFIYFPVFERSYDGDDTPLEHGVLLLDVPFRGRFLILSTMSRTDPLYFKETTVVFHPVPGPRPSHAAGPPGMRQPSPALRRLGGGCCSCCSWQNHRLRRT